MKGGWAAINGVYVLFMEISKLIYKEKDIFFFFLCFFENTQLRRFLDGDGKICVIGISGMLRFFLGIFKLGNFEKKIVPMVYRPN